MFHFIKTGTPWSTIEDYFGPIEKDDVFIEITEMEGLEHLAVQMKIFPSINQARKNNWSGEISPGFQEHRKGKRKFFTYKSPTIDEDYLYQKYWEDIEEGQPISWWLYYH